MSDAPTVAADVATIEAAAKAIPDLATVTAPAAPVVQRVRIESGAGVEVIHYQDRAGVEHTYTLAATSPVLENVHRGLEAYMRDAEGAASDYVASLRLAGG